MVVELKINNFSEVKAICAFASENALDIFVKDRNNFTADAQSLLGLMSLDYSCPVLISSSDSPADEEKIISFLNSYFAVKSKKEVIA